MSTFSLNDPPSLRKATPPERIYNWQHTQLSIASYYGGITYNGAQYVIDYDDPLEPLVRKDLMKAKAKPERRAALERGGKDTQNQIDF